MTATEIVLWCLVMLLGFGGSALFSGMETGCYTLNRVRLQVLADRGKRAALSLRKIVDQTDSMLATLLIGNNIANYLGTASLAVLLEAMALSDVQTVLLNTLIVTPLLFVFGETLPKDTMAAHSDRLMYPLAPMLTGSKTLFTAVGLVPIVRLFSKGVLMLMGHGRDESAFAPRRRVEMLVREGVGHGILSDEQSAIVDRVLRLAGRRVKQEMIPWREVITVKLTDPPAKLWEFADRTSRSRFPVMDGGQVVGIISVIDVLSHDRDACPPIAELMTEPLSLDESMPARQALRRLQKSKTSFALVVQDHQPTGLVTIKDLVEPITGELASW
jgi:CBS domain containing-hemolysin-like protein